MKVNLVTFHRAYNYGAVLQCYALLETLENLGVDAEVLDYWPKVFKDIYSMRFEINISRSSIKNILKKIFILPKLKKRNKSFENFINGNIRLTNRIYRTKKQIESDVLDADAFITGSDQVWHYVWTNFDPVYFLDFVNAQKKKKFSYAASFGMKEIPHDLCDEYKRRLIGYNAYSVREQSGVIILNNLLGVEAECCCDPTLLLNENSWRGIIKPMENLEPYILVYYTSRSRLLQDSAEELSQRTGYRVICLPCTMDYDIISGKFDKTKGFEVQASAGPYEFLALFANAEYVLTNTFHGSVFSIIFRKQFLTQMNLPNGDKNTRVEELFEELGIKDRNLEDNLDKMDNVIFWDVVEQNRQKLANKSIAYLKDIIQSVK